MDKGNESNFVGISLGFLYFGMAKAGLNEIYPILKAKFKYIIKVCLIDLLMVFFLKDWPLTVLVEITVFHHDIHKSTSIEVMSTFPK